MGGSSSQTVYSTTKVTPMQCWWVVEVTFLCGMVLLNLLYSSVAVIGSTSPIMDMVQNLTQTNNAQSTRDIPKLGNILVK